MKLPRDSVEVTEENKLLSEIECCPGETTPVGAKELVPRPRVSLSYTQVGRFGRG